MRRIAVSLMASNRKVNNVESPADVPDQVGQENNRSKEIEQKGDLSTIKTTRRVANFREVSLTTLSQYFCVLLGNL